MAAGLAAVGYAGAGLNAMGSVTKGKAAQQSDQAISANALYQAQVAANNRVIAANNVALTAEKTAAQESIEGRKVAARVGTARVADATISGKSKEDVIQATRTVGAEAVGNVASEGAKTAYGYMVAEQNAGAEEGLQKMKSTEALAAGDESMKAGEIGGLGTFLDQSSKTYKNWAESA